MPVRSREIHALSSRARLPIMRKLLSVMDGQHSGVRPGHGWDFLDLAEYHAGDDVQDIDWAATARTGQAIIRRYESTANLQVVMLVDTGRSMGALAPSGEPKIDVATRACEAIAWLAVARGDQLGAISGDSEKITISPARSGNAYAEMLLRRIRATITLETPASNVTALLERAFVAIRRRSLIVLATDSVQPEPGSQADAVLAKLTRKHAVIVVSVDDMNPTDLPKGTRIIDVDQGPLPDFLLGDKQLADQAKLIVSARRQEVASLLDHRGVIRVSVSGSKDVPRALMSALERGTRVR